MRTDKARGSVAEPILLRLEAVAPEGVRVEMPDLEEQERGQRAAGGQRSTSAKSGMGGLQLGELVVRDVREQPSVLLNGHRHYVREYTLESYTSGEQTIPALTLRYFDAAGSRPARSASEGADPSASYGSTTSQPASAPASGGEFAHEVQTPPITITIESALAGETDPTRFRDVKGLVDVPLAASRRWLRWLAGALILILACTAFFILLRRTSRGKKADPEIPPGTWAFQQLRQLEGERLVEQGLFHEFYFRLTDVVRQYIERRFALRAPERTTSEFLVEVQDHPALARGHQLLLADFLQAADMVKFACYEPGREECDGALTTARCFVEETAYTVAPDSPTPTENDGLLSSIPSQATGLNKEQPASDNAEREVTP